MAWKIKDFFSGKGNPLETSADTWFQRGNTHVSQRQWQAALECFREAGRIDPHHAAAHAYAGNVLRLLGQPDAAMASYDRAITARPDYAEVHYNRGAILHEARQVSAALDCFDAALTINPSFPEAHFSRGEALRDLGRLDEALESFDAAIAINPDHVGAHAQRGSALMELGHLDAALASFDRAIQLKPDFARMYSNRAQAQASLGLHAAARASHDQAAMLDPRDAAIHFNRGAFLSEGDDQEEAVRSYLTAIELKPDYAEAYCNLGLIRHKSGQREAALENYSQALAINPRLATAFNNRGNLFRANKQFTEALSDYRQAVALDPTSADVHYNMGQLALLQGNLTEGWPQYEYRRLIKEALAVSPRKLSAPAWTGKQPLAGRRIFLYAEQGLGDTLQFCRYVSRVASHGAHVILEVQPSLGELLAQLDGVSQLILAGDPVPPADYQCSLMSLPGAFQTTLETIPGRVPYLRPDPSKVSRWREILGPRSRPRIGLVWSGNPRQTNEHNRRVPLAQWITHLPDQFDYISLQNEIRDADRETLRNCANIKTFDADLAERAALIETLDLVISVDTSLAHLSGALGKEIWMLLSFLPDWRWLLDRRDSPWYPTATLYRQPAVGDWESVLVEVQRNLLQSTFNPLFGQSHSD